MITFADKFIPSFLSGDKKKQFEAPLCDHMAVGTAHRMSIREAHQKALHLLGKYAYVEEWTEAVYPSHLPVGPCRIGVVRGNYFYLMTHGKTFEQAFNQLQLAMQADRAAPGGI